MKIATSATIISILVLVLFPILAAVLIRQVTRKYGDTDGRKWQAIRDVYRGDRLAKLSPYAGQICRGVLQPNGKCIRGKNGNMLVDFAGRPC
ncbi:hypothetical protein [Phaeodactylibacter xiamenensis]|uniref:hypothetical protein n=1 Tax=Phaeodactylibacter xiamenensis TaxID=1524460 RepID=UPI003CCBC874